jgi:hypothetical protein
MEAISARFARHFGGWNRYGKWLESAHTILAVGKDVCATMRSGGPSQSPGEGMRRYQLSP